MGQWSVERVLTDIWSCLSQLQSNCRVLSRARQALRPARRCGGESVRETAGPAELDGESGGRTERQRGEPEHRRCRARAELPSPMDSPAGSEMEPGEEGSSPWHKHFGEPSISLAQRKGWKLNTPAKSSLVWSKNDSGGSFCCLRGLTPTKWTTPKYRS